MKAEGPRAADTAFAMSVRRQKPQQMQGTKTKLRRCSSARNKFHRGICLYACDSDGTYEGWSAGEQQNMPGEKGWRELEPTTSSGCW